MTAFLKYFEAGFLDSVLPILPPDAKMSDDSNVDDSNRGKIPGEYKLAQQAWVGMHDWTERVFTVDDLKRWERWPECNVGMSTRLIPTVDIDCEEADIVEEIAALCELHLGWAPRRGRDGSPRIAMPYRWADGEIAVGKLRIPFSHYMDKKLHAVEFLCSGQQFVVEGTHPSGNKYEWASGFDLATVRRGGLTAITTNEWIYVANAIEDMLRARGFEIGRKTKSRGRKLTKREEGERQARVIALDPDDVLTALFAIPVKNGKPDYDYGKWIELSIAFYAAVNGDEKYFRPWVEWSLQHPEAQNEEYLKGKWDSFPDDSGIGKSLIFAEARKHGWEGGADDMSEIPFEGAADQAAADERLQAHELRLAGGEAKVRLPTIPVTSGNYDVVEAEMELWLLKHPHVKLYRKGGFLVEAVEAEVDKEGGKARTDLTFPRVEPKRMQRILDGIARFQVQKADGEWKFDKCPLDLVEGYLQKYDQWKMPLIVGVTSAPILRDDCTVHTTPGYDPQTDLYYRAGDIEFPEFKSDWSKADAERARDRILTELLGGFPFDTPLSKSVALSHILSRIGISLFPRAPIHLFSAPQAGSGKSLLVDVASALYHGMRAAMMNHTPKMEEFEKRLDGQLLTGLREINIDNIKEEYQIGGETLALISTSDTKKVRPLGTSKLVTMSCKRVYITANGNNLRVKDDIRRRSLLCRIDPGVARPELRKFQFDPIERILRDRGSYIADIYGMFAAYKQAGFPCSGQLSPFGSFEQWSHWVRGLIVWLGMPDPLLSQDLIMAEDITAAELVDVLENWYDAFGSTEFTVHELLEAIEKAAPLEGTSPASLLREAIVTVAAVQNSGARIRPPIDSKRLGHWLSAKRGHVAGDKRIVNGPKVGHNNTLRWKVEKLAE